MEEVKKWECPYYHKVIDSDECYEMFLIASRMVRDEDVVKEEDRDALFSMCEECQKYTL